MAGKAGEEGGREVDASVPAAALAAVCDGGYLALALVSDSDLLPAVASAVPLRVVERNGPSGVLAKASTGYLIAGLNIVEGACARKGPDRGHEEDGSSERSGNGARLHDLGLDGPVAPCCCCRCGHAGWRSGLSVGLRPQGDRREAARTCCWKGHRQGRCENDLEREWSKVQPMSVWMCNGKGAVCVSEVKRVEGDVFSGPRLLLCPQTRRAESCTGLHGECAEFSDVERGEVHGYVFSFASMCS